MRLAALASVLAAGLIALAMAVAPLPSQADSRAGSCATCGKGKVSTQRWEYKCVRPGKKPDAMTQQFAAMGDEGWRLEEADGGVWCFARMKPSL